MGNLDLGQHDLIRFPKLKIGHHDPLKVKLDVSYTCCPPVVYTAYVIAKLIKFCHIDLIK